MLIYLVAYVVLNPVRAGMVARAEDHRWSSYAATAAISPAPPWLDHARTLAHFAQTDADNPSGFVRTIESICQIGSAPLLTRLPGLVGV